MRQSIVRQPVAPEGGHRSRQLPRLVSKEQDAVSDNERGRDEHPTPGGARGDGRWHGPGVRGFTTDHFGNNPREGEAIRRRPNQEMVGMRATRRGIRNARRRRAQHQGAGIAWRARRGFS
uniref:Putative bacteriophage t7-related protein n=1 Tax=uncultured marine virus TaxID=186617 RepID=A0A0F7L9K0_9VIRU|nr:putative bacteriophage t7-related protein [uncultured marine virus]